MRFIFIISIVCLMMAFPRAEAFVYGPEGFVDGVTKSTLEIVESKSLTVVEKRKKLEDLFEESVDIDWIAKFVLGRFWNEASEEERAEYSGLYRKFLLDSYVPKFRVYTNHRLNLKKVVNNGDGEFVVFTEIVSEGGPSVRVNYRLRKGGERGYKIYDIAAEGISMITTQRSDFSSILSRKGLAYLIDRLRAKVSG